MFRSSKDNLQVWGSNENAPTHQKPPSYDVASTKKRSTGKNVELRFTPIDQNSNQSELFIQISEVRNYR